ncbi:MAG: hypothetical protein AAFV25_25385 [Bacteroidota bacterium]
MESTQNATYFETQLVAASQGLNNSAVTLLISDTVQHARQLEASGIVIPAGDNPGSKLKPGSPKADEFQQRLDQLTSISQNLRTLFEEFIAYIRALENQLPS